MSTRFTVKPTYEDYLAANRLAFRRSIFSRGMLVAAIIVMGMFLAVELITSCIGCGISSVLSSDAFITAALFTLGIAVVVGITWAALLPFNSRKMFKKLGTVDQEVQFTFSDTGFVAESATGNSKLEWSHLTDFVSDDRCLVLRRTPFIIYLIPVAQLAPGLADRLVARLHTAGVKEA
jgi:hypothetical protein